MKTFLPSSFFLSFVMDLPEEEEEEEDEEVDDAKVVNTATDQTNIGLSPRIPLHKPPTSHSLPDLYSLAMVVFSGLSRKMLIND